MDVYRTIWVEPEAERSGGRSSARDPLRGDRHPAIDALTAIGQLRAAGRRGWHMTWFKDAVEQASRWLPHQGPLGVFIHHNTLETWEHLPFHEALDAARNATGARVRLRLAELRPMLADGRIDPGDLDAAFDQVAPEREAVASGLPTAAELAWGLLVHGRHSSHWRIRAFQVAEGRPDPFVAVLDARTLHSLAMAGRRALSFDPEGTVALITGSTDPEERDLRMRRQVGAESLDELLGVCRDSDLRAAELGYAVLQGTVLAGLPPRERTPSRVSDQSAVDRAVDEVLLPPLQARLDLGQASWLPPVEPGLLSLGVLVLERRYREVLDSSGARELARLVATRCGLGEPESGRAVARSVLVRPGWAGALVMADHHDLGRLEELAALRLAATWLEARERGLDVPATLLPAGEPVPGPVERAARLAQALVRHRVGIDLLRRLTAEQWTRLEKTVDSFTDDMAAAVLQEARDRSARRHWLVALDGARRRSPEATPARRVQVLLCIDDREESFRRALEELGGQAVETFGVAGHFGLALLWRGAGEQHDGHRHPPALRATHRLVEEAAPRPARRCSTPLREAAASPKLLSSDRGVGQPGAHRLARAPRAGTSGPGPPETRMACCPRLPGRYG